MFVTIAAEWIRTRVVWSQKQSLSILCPKSVYVRRVMVACYPDDPGSSLSDVENVNLNLNKTVSWAMVVLQLVERFFRYQRSSVRILPLANFIPILSTAVITVLKRRKQRKKRPGEVPPPKKKYTRALFILCLWSKERSSISNITMLLQKF